MSEVAAVILSLLGGVAGGLVGVGGGVLFVPALIIFLTLTQVEAESTSLLMVVIVAAIGAIRQNRHGNVRVREGVLIGLFALPGVLLGVAAANWLPERILQLSFAALAVLMAVQLLRRARSLR